MVDMVELTLITDKVAYFAICLERGTRGTMAFFFFFGVQSHESLRVAVAAAEQQGERGEQE